MGLILVILSACTGKEEVVEMENKSFSGMLLIGKVEDNASSKELTKIVRDKQKIEKILTMVEGLEVKETDSDSFTEKLKSQDSYSFSFFEGEVKESDFDALSGKQTPYTFIILNDGTIFFLHKDVNTLQEPRMTIEKHQDLLNEMKQLTEVDF